MRYIGLAVTDAARCRQSVEPAMPRPVAEAVIFPPHHNNVAPSFIRPINRPHSSRPSVRRPGCSRRTAVGQSVARPRRSKVVVCLSSRVPLWAAEIRDGVLSWTSHSSAPSRACSGRVQPPWDRQAVRYSSPRRKLM